MTTEISKDSVGGGPCRVGPDSGNGFFYQHASQDEGEDGVLDLPRREAGRAPRRGRQEGAETRP